MRRLRLAAIFCACLALPAAAWAASKAPVKGAQYEGVTSHEGPAVLESAKGGRKKATILLRVARNGKTVKVLVPVLPTKCPQTGQGPIEKSSPARISSKGAFSGTIVYKTVFSPKETAKASFTGRFNGRRATGTLRSEFLTTPSCNDTSSFAATAPAPKHK